jgi:redox-sensitive bicupin YhaK (pirin superfamily)
MAAILERTAAKPRDIGFTVRRALPSVAVRSLGPFVFLDHMGPAHFAATGTEGDVRAHPHIGLATVTYLFSGAMMHRDSLGSVQRIEPGAVNWMTSGAGIVHSERLPEDVRQKNIAVEGIQMWVALPAAEEDCAPGFWHYSSEVLPTVSKPGAAVHVLCGSFDGVSSPVTTPSPSFYLAAEMSSGGSITLQADYAERGIYIACGSVQIEGEIIGESELVSFTPGAIVAMTALEDTRLMILGGAPLDGPRHLWWNFVSSSQDKIEAAKLRWKNQEFVPVPGEVEFIPLPDR